MSVARRVLAALVIGCACAVVASCGLDTLTSSFLGTSTPSTVPSPAKVATAGAVPASEAASGTHTDFASSPRPAPADPLLAKGSWGYRKTKTVGKRLDSEPTWALHEMLLQDRFSELMREQREDILDIFEDSSRVHRVIRSNGGDPDDAVYTCQYIQAGDAVAVGTPWAYGTFRAAFPTRDGQKAVECRVYRLKTSKGLDKRPFVSSTIVGFMGLSGTVRNPKEVRLR